MLRILVSLLALSMVAQSSYAKVWNVPQDGNLSSILSHLHNGDEVIVSPGLYQETISIGQNVYVHSIDPNNPQVVEATIIQGNLPVYISHGTPTTARISGFTLSGAGCSAVQSIHGKAQIDHCRIIGNRGFTPATPNKPSMGGAFYQCDGVIENNVIERNSAELGGAFYQCHGLIQNNVVARNYCTPYNTQAAGAAFYDCKATIRNNTIVDNGIRHPQGWPITYTWTGGGLAKCTGTILNNIIWNSRSDMVPEFTTCSLPTYSCIKGWIGGGVGNFDRDPLLVQARFDETLGSVTPLIAQDWHLRPESLCVDAGAAVTSVTTDLDGVARGKVWRSVAGGDGSHMDVGAYEFDPGALSVWVPQTNDPALGLRSVPIYWVLNDPPDGTTLTLTLERQGGEVLGSLGTFFFASGHATFESAGLISPMLPQTGPGDDYLIRMRGAGGMPEALSPLFAIRRFSGLEMRVWAGYQ